MSDNYIVSARKYRPALFSSVIGQAHIVRTLMNSIVSNHVAHAFLFTGPRGVGKTTCARILAKALNCENISPDGEPCDECPSCLMFHEQRTFNIYELDAASNNSVDDIRALVDQVRYPPQSGKYKIYIIDEVHMLSTNAFNAFLKTLEEPPSYAVFILATTEKHKIIPTIISRCQIFDFNRIKINDIKEHLKYIATKENVTFDEESLHIIAQKSDGALRDALSIFDRIVSFTNGQVTYKNVIENLNIIDYEYFFSVTDHILEGNSSGCLLLFDKLFQSGYDGQNFIDGLSEHLRNILVCKNPQTVELFELPYSSLEKYKLQASKADLQTIISALNILNLFGISYKESKNQRLHTELALIKLCYIKNAIQLSEKYKDLSQDQKKKLTESTSSETAQLSDIGDKPETPAIENNDPIKEKKIGNLARMRENALMNSVSEVKDQVSNGEDNTYSKQEKTDRGKFINAWNNYLSENLKDNKPNLYNTLIDRQLEFPDEYSVLVLVDNAALSEMLSKERMAISKYMREKFNISGYSLKIEVKPPADDEKKKYITNPRELYFEMLTTNPDLGKLQLMLDLEVET